jgi:hypothetical protein
MFSKPMEQKAKIDRMRPHKLAIIGWALPYVVVIIPVGINLLLPYETRSEKWTVDSTMVIRLLPICILLGALLVGFYSAGRKVQRPSWSRPWTIFLFSFLGVAIAQFLVAYAFMSIVPLSPLIYGSNISVDASKYEGDGTLVSIEGNMLDYGYRIEFDEFDFREPFQQKYVLSHFPKIDDSYSFGVSTYFRDNNISEFLEGNLALKAYTATNNILFECQGPLEEWTYSSSRNDDGTYRYFIYFFANRTESLIDPEKLKDIDTINFVVNYTPGFMRESIMGRVEMRVGGYK